MKFDKPTIADLPQIKFILTQWTDPEEVAKYMDRISTYIEGKIEFGTRYYVSHDEGGKASGIAALSDILPKIQSFSQTTNPGEIKILYLDNKSRGKGLGRAFISFLESEALKIGYKEMLVRSAEQYKDTAYGFYEKLGYTRIRNIEGGSAGKMMAVFRKTL